MGGFFSSPSQNPSDIPTTDSSPSSSNPNQFQNSDRSSNPANLDDSANIDMSNSSSKILESESTETVKTIAQSEASDQNPSIDTNAHEDQTPEVSDQSKDVLENGEKGEGEEGEGEGEEEEGECGFCLYMKGGGCKDNFVAWEQCIEEAEKKQEDIVEKCFEVTGMLKKCMEAHADYYEPILRAEKAAEEVAVQELEKEKEKEKQSEQNEVKQGSEQNLGMKELEQNAASTDKTDS